jgi:hypothetical protein
MIKVNKYEVQTIEHFDSEGNSLGFLNHLESIDLRTQIAQQRAEGYYVLLNNSKIMIDSTAHFDNWGNGLYDLECELLRKLLKAQM